MKNEFTKKEILTAIIAIATAEDAVDVKVGEKVIPAEAIAEYAEKTIAQLDTKNEKAKKNQAKKKAEDALRAIVADVLTEENQTADEIVAQVPATVTEGNKEVEVTRAKVVARLAALIKDGVAVKEEIKVEGTAGTRKVMAYRVAVEDVAADVDAE